MPTLLLMRHAKSDWSDEGRPDHDRPLNKRGKQDAPRMGRWLAKQGLVPARIVTSSARRARKTADGVREGLEAEVPIEMRDELYHSSAPHWRRVLAEFSPDDSCVLCIGHNPELQELVDSLVGRHERMPTAAIACLEVQGEGWSTFGSEAPDVMLRVVWRPKELDLDS